MMQPSWSAGPMEVGLVSIVVTAYNQEMFVKETLESVSQQTFRPIECVLIDDGSTDGTSGVANEFVSLARSDLRFRYSCQSNQGAQAARNAGIALCQGEFIQFLDGDDLLARDKVQVQVEALRANPGLDVVYGDANLLVPEGNGFRVSERIGMGPSTDFLSSLLDGAWNANFSYLCRRSAVSRCGPWDPEVRLNQDYDYFLRMACHGFRFGYVPHSTGMYRKHGHVRISERPIIERARATLGILQTAERVASTAGTLTHFRRTALARAYRRVSYWCFGQDNDTWRASLGAALRLCPDLPAETLLARSLQSVCGVWATESLLGVARELKRRIKPTPLPRPRLV